MPLQNASEKYVMFPIKNNEIWKMYKHQVDCFWKTDEIHLHEDVVHWKEKLNDSERYFISMVLAFFAASDGIVMENLAIRFMKDVELPEARAFYGFQIAMENIHSEMYSIMIDTLIQSNEEKHKLFTAIESFPSIRMKSEWAHKWIEDSQSNFATRLVAFACVEGIFFSSSFASINWIKKRGLMPGLTSSNELISRDESLHTDFAVLLYSQLPPEQKLDESVLKELIKDSVCIEKVFITESLPCRLIGMNSEMMKQYIEFVADRLCVQLGASKCFNSVNPFEFMVTQSLYSKVNFFERLNTSYALTNNTENESEIFDSSVDF